MKNQYGQSVTEFLIIMPIFFALLFGIFEFSMIYRAKATLNSATFEAARLGALNHARIGPIKDGLRKGMMPLYMRGKNNAAGMAAAYGRVWAQEKAMNLTHPTVTIVSPTKSMYDKFKVQRMIKFNHQSREKKQYYLPNDNLLFRSTETEKVKVNGGNFDISIQDANLLKIRTHWCYPMRVPVLRRIVNEVISGGWFGMRASREQRACNLANLGRTDTIALASTATVRMQSPVVFEGKNLK